MSMIPEASSYPIDPRYDQFYKSTMNPGTVSISRHSNIHNNIRSGDRQPLVSQTMPTSQSNWNPSIMTGLDPIEPFVSQLNSNWQSTNADFFSRIVHKRPGEEFGGL